jgi:hypothetical protein
MLDESEDRTKCPLQVVHKLDVASHVAWCTLEQVDPVDSCARPPVSIAYWKAKVSLS